MDTRCKRNNAVDSTLGSLRMAIPCFDGATLSTRRIQRNEALPLATTCAAAQLACDLKSRRTYTCSCGETSGRPGKPKQLTMPCRGIFPGDDAIVVLGFRTATLVITGASTVLVPARALLDAPIKVLMHSLPRNQPVENVPCAFVTVDTATESTT